MKNDKNYTSAIIISVVLHLALVAALLWGADFNMSEPKQTGSMVQAVVIDPQLVQKQAREIRKQREAATKAEQGRLDKLRKQSEELEKNRQAEEERIRKLKEDKARADKATREAKKQRKLEQERVRKEQERVKQEQARVKQEQARLKQEKERVKKQQEKLRIEKELAVKAEAERKKKQEEIKRAEEVRLAKQQAAIEKAEKERIAREKAAAEAKVAAEKAEQERIAKEKAAKEAAEKARREKERLERLERERKEQEAALGDIFSGLEAESAENTSAKQKFVESEAERYGAIYTQLIQNNLLMEDAFRGKFCKVSLRLLPTGTDAILSSVEVISGDKRLCAATKRAVTQVGNFPLPADKDVVNKVKNINLMVVPE